MDPAKREQLQRTIFVVGAGGADPYGFPVQDKLVSQMFAAANAGDSAAPDWMPETRRALKDLYPDAEVLRHDARRLRNSGFRTIDAFMSAAGPKNTSAKLDLHLNDMEALRADIEWRMKALLFAVLSPYEALHRKTMEQSGQWHRAGDAKDKDWYAKYWAAWYPLLLRENQPWVNVICFNYDRSFEAAMYSMAEATHPGSGSAAIDNLRISHPHGTLGGAYDHATYGTGLGEEWWRNVKAITAIHEAPTLSERSAEAIQQAKRIVFVGFGYHTDIVSKIVKADPGFERRVDQGELTLFGTARGINKERVEEVKALLWNKVSLGNETEETPPFLARLRIL